MRLSRGSSVEQVLARFIDGGYNPAPLLLQWLDYCQVAHNGKLDGGEENNLPPIVSAMQNYTQRYHPDGRPKARTEVDLSAEDARFLPPQKVGHYRHLSKLGLFEKRYSPPSQPLDYLLWHATYLPQLLQHIDTLIECWQQGVRWKKLIFLGAACSVGADMSEL